MSTTTRRRLWWLALLALAVASTAALAQSIPRFHRYAFTRLDDTTTIDVVKDAATGTCWAVYRVRELHTGPYDGSSARAVAWPFVAVTTLGATPCHPLPVASPIR